MKLVSFANRLARDFKERSLAELSADARLELVDAINSPLQRMWAVMPGRDKITSICITLAAPAVVTLTVTNGSDAFTGYTVTDDQLYCTIRIGGDQADNHIVADGRLLLPYSGNSGAITATIYSDAQVLPAEYGEITRDPFDVDFRQRLYKDDTRSPRWNYPTRYAAKPIQRPTAWWVEANAADADPLYDSVFRVNSLPDQMYRLQSEASLVPPRITFADLLDATKDIPIRDEHVEAYLLPMCRKELVTSTLWRNKDAIAAVTREGENALARYELLANTTNSLPDNRVGIPIGW